MRKDIKRKLPLLIGIGLPMLLVLWVLIFVYFLPRIFLDPQYNFVYVISYNKQSARVIENRAQIDPCPYPYLNEPVGYRDCDQYLREFNFYLYDVKNDENTPLSLDEVNAYSLDPSDKSPDDYVVSGLQRDSGDYFFFPFFWGGGASRSPQIRKGAFSKQISLRDNYYNFKFLGWVLEQK